MTKSVQSKSILCNQVSESQRCKKHFHKPTLRVIKCAFITKYKGPRTHFVMLQV